MPKEGGPGQEGATRGIAVLKGTAAHNAFARLREENARELRRGRRLEAIFRLGGLRSIFELIEELIRHGLIGEAEIEWRLAAYAELDPRALKITGGDRLTPLPQIVENVTGFFAILADWSRAELRVPANDIAKPSTLDAGELSDER